MPPIEIVRDVHWIGVPHPDIRMFDDLLPSPRGTTYNSYLVKGQKTAVIDAVEERFADAFLRNIRGLTDPAGIDFIVLNHSESDHSGCLEALLKAAPRAQVYASRAAKLYLQDILNRSFECRTIEDSDPVDLGGRTLHFIPAPFMHWPDTIFTWLPEDGILFSSDAFGSHVCDERLFDDRVGDFAQDFHLYYDGLMRPYRDRVLNGLDRLKELDIRTICPSHGPILRMEPARYIQKYRDWATLKPRPRPYIAIFYVSTHGSTQRMAQAIAEGARRLNVDVELVRATETDDARARDAIETADGLLFGAPTVVRDLPPAMWRVLALLSTVKPHARKTAAFGSYGWSGEVVSIIEQRLREMRLPVVPSPCRVKFTPDDSDLAACRDFGERFAAEVIGG